MSIDREAADRLLTTTRGVRRRLDFDRPVERAVIDESIRIAMQAPVGSEWITHFIAIADAQIRQQVADIYAALAHPYLDDLETKLHDAAQTQDQHQAADKEMHMHRWYTDNLHRAPVMVIAAMRWRFDGQPAAMLAGRFGSNLPTAWSFMLALRARGLGTCWTTLHIYRERDVAALLGIPDDITQTVLFPVAYYKGEDFKPASRPPAEEFIHWDRW